MFIDPDGIDTATLDRNAQQLAKSLNLKQADLAREFRKAHDEKKRFVWIARASTQTLRTRSLSSSFPECKHNSSRSVTTRTAHLLHMSSVTSDSMAKGLGGVEQFSTRKISGEPGQSFSKETRRQALRRLRDRCKASQAVILTIDQTIQYQAEQALQAAVQQSRAKSGSVIVLDPRSGEILALANAPTFDPNRVSDAKPETRSNWALQNIYEPGST